MVQESIEFVRQGIEVIENEHIPGTQTAIAVRQNKVEEYRSQSMCTTTRSPRWYSARNG